MTDNNNNKRPRDPQHTTFLHLLFVSDPMFPTILRHEGELTDEQIKMLSNSLPSIRRSQCTIEGYDPETDEFDENVWIPVEITPENASYRCDTPSTIIHAWLDE